MPVHQRQSVGLQQVHAAPFLPLIQRERFLPLQVVVELRKDQLAIPCDQRARGVAIICVEIRCSLLLLRDRFGIMDVHALPDPHLFQAQPSLRLSRAILVLSSRIHHLCRQQ